MVLKLDHASTEQLLRLDRIARHLNLSSKPDDREFVDEAVAAAVDRVDRVVQKTSPRSGDELLAALAASYGVCFEEVRVPRDVVLLKERYLEGQRELGFALLDDELSDPGVDALLFQLTRSGRGSRKRFVAVLNLQEADFRAYWSRSHELSHRVAEPAQKLLPFRRHRIEAANPVERLIDQIAAEIAFYPPLFHPLVRSLAQRGPLTLDATKTIQRRYAPTASLLSTLSAVAKHWPEPAIVVTAAMRGRINQPEVDVALRARLAASNAAARKTDLSVWNNMRVPPSSPLYAAFVQRGRCDDEEDLGKWTTSGGRSLPARRVLTSAIGRKSHAYALISLRA